MSERDSVAWDSEAEKFDEEPDHGLRDPDVRAAWHKLLTQNLPTAPSDVADIGCGTGTLTVLLAEAGYRVHGLDFSTEMLSCAAAKAERAGVQVELSQADASNPPLEAGTFDVVLCRHVLWALPDPEQAVLRWSQLLRPGGRLLLIEGRWSTGAGLGAERTRALLETLGGNIEVQRLTDPALWGGPVTDERYLAMSTAHP